jgi:hypothetical protein
MRCESAIQFQIDRALTRVETQLLELESQQIVAGVANFVNDL